MKVEIVGFYKNIDRKFKMIGTMHIYLVDLDLDIRGIVVNKGAKGRWFYRMPGRHGLDPETKEMMWYPHVSFSNKEMHDEMIQSIIEEGDKFLKIELTKDQKKS